MNRQRAITDQMFQHHISKMFQIVIMSCCELVIVIISYGDILSTPLEFPTFTSQGSYQSVSHKHSLVYRDRSKDNHELKVKESEQ